MDGKKKKSPLKNSGTRKRRSAATADVPAQTAPPLPPEISPAGTTHSDDSSNVVSSHMEDSLRQSYTDLVAELEHTKQQLHIADLKVERWASRIDDLTQENQTNSKMKAELDSLKQFHNEVMLAVLTAKRDTNANKQSLINAIELAAREQQQRKTSAPAAASVLSVVQAKLHELKNDKDRRANQVLTQHKLVSLNLSQQTVQVVDQPAVSLTSPRLVLREGYSGDER